MRKRSWVIAGRVSGIAFAIASASTSLFAAEKTIDPGLYEVVTKSSMGGAQTARTCLTAADITNGFATSNAPKECKYTRSVVAGGKLDFASTCPDMTMTMTGTYTSSSYAIDGKVVMKGDDPMTIESHITGRKIADTCKAG